MTFLTLVISKKALYLNSVTLEVRALLSDF